MAAIILILALITGIRSFEIRRDNSSEAIVFYQIGHINIQNTTKILTYETNFSVLNTFEENFALMNETCGQDIKLMGNIAKKVREIQQILKSIETKEKYPKAIESNSYTHINEIEDDLNKVLMNDSIAKCKTVRRLASILTRVYVEINAISREEFGELNEILSISKVQGDVQELIGEESWRNFKFPFDLSFKFYVDFVRNSKISITFNNNILFITFEFGIYEQFELYTLNPKPLVIDENVFVLKAHSEFTAMKGERTVLYTESDLNELCNEHETAKFCSIPTEQNECDWECANKRGISKMSKQCFLKLPRENTAIQVYSSVYFSVLKPMTILVNCGDEDFPIYLDKSSYFDSMANCSLKTDFFEFNPKFDNKSYKLSF